MPGSPAPEASGPQGYQYWVRGGEGAPAPEPKALTAEEAAALRPSTTTAGGGSAWNVAGTWEDRDCSAAAKAGVRARLEGLVVRGGDGSSTLATVKSVDSLEGEATVTIVRGVRRAGFDFDAALTWEGEGEEGQPAAGTARIPNLASDELDDLQVTDVRGDGGGSVPVGLGRALAQAVGEAVAGLAAELAA